MGFLRLLVLVEEVMRGVDGRFQSEEMRKSGRCERGRREEKRIGRRDRRQEREKSIRKR